MRSCTGSMQRGIALEFCRVRADARARLDHLGLLGDHRVFDTNRAAIAALSSTPQHGDARRRAARRSITHG